jgi:CheY-like chemotaxis protein
MMPWSTKTRMPTSDLPPRRTRVVIVEDNPDTADSYRLLLSLRGYEVRVAHTGPEGVRLAQEWPPDVVLCDLGLPGLDGYGVAAALRQHPATARARLIAVTGYGSDAARRRSQEVGFEQHLVKPVDPGALLELLAAR